MGRLAFLISSGWSEPVPAALLGSSANGPLLCHLSCLRVVSMCPGDPAALSPDKPLQVSLSVLLHADSISCPSVHLVSNPRKTAPKWMTCQVSAKRKRNHFEITVTWASGSGCREAGTGRQQGVRTQGFCTPWRALLRVHGPT